ncbi:hypothetical protein [Bacillus sp. B1-b2]|nr:hypothetical protein [Bacillus sp. B1-b2]
MENLQNNDFKDILVNVVNEGNKGATMQEILRLLELELLKLNSIIKK